MWQNFREHLDKLYHHYLANPISAEQICGGYPDKPIVLCDGLEEKRLNDGSLFTDDGEALCFNGNAADDMNHETFIVQREIPVEDYWDFCKTTYKPYDVFVVAALLLLYNLCRDIFGLF